MAARTALPEVWGILVRMIERDCPWHFVEWAELGAPLVPPDPVFDELRAAG